MQLNAFFDVVVPLAAVGAVQAYKMFKDRNWEGLITIVVAALVGLAAGLTHYLGMDLQTALTLAMSAVGVHTVLANKS